MPLKSELSNTPTEAGSFTAQAALIIIDMQEAFLRTIPGSRELLSRCCFASEAAKLMEVPVFLTEQVPDKLGSLHPELKAAASQGRVFEKSAFSALNSSALLSSLRNGQFNHLLLGGLETSICVYQTAIQALQERFEVTLLTDCIGARRANDELAVLDYLKREKRCHLLPSETIFYSLLGGADHPSFRTFTSLVKKYSEQTS